MCSRHVDVWRGGQVADDQLWRRRHGFEMAEHGVGDMFDIEVNDSRLHPKSEHPRDRFVSLMSLEIGITTSPRDASEERDMRRRSAPNEENKGNHRADQNPAQDSGPKHPEKGGHGHEKFAAVDL